MITGAVVVVFNAMGKTLIVRRHAGDRWMPGKWALVGGKLEEGESSCDAVIREAKEETWVYPEELTNYQQGAQLVPGLINMVRNAEEILLRYA